MRPTNLKTHFECVEHLLESSGVLFCKVGAVWWMLLAYRLAVIIWGCLVVLSGVGVPIKEHTHTEGRELFMLITI